MIPKIVLPLERGALVVDGDEVAVGDGNAVGLARHVVQDPLWSAEWLLRVDHPFGVVQGSEACGECLAVGEHGVISEELKSR